MKFTAENQRLFDAAYKKAVNCDEDSKLVGLMDLMLRLLLEAGEAELMFINPMRVVPHNSNRGGANMEYLKMFGKISKILGVGFSLSKCDPSRAVCFQKRQGKVMKFVENANRCKYFAKFEQEKVDAGSVGCGHLNQGLCAISQGIPIPPEYVHNADLVGQTGKKYLDQRDICQRDEDITHAKDLSNTISTGLKWTYIYAHVEEKYPELPNIFQKALNVEHHIGEGETWDEQFGAIARSIVKYYGGKADKKAPDSKALAREALASKPPRADDVVSQVEFCKRWGGKHTQEYVLDICEYIKLKGNMNVVAGSTLDALTKLQVPIDMNITNFVAAVVKNAATRGNTRLGLSIGITEADIKTIVAKRIKSAKEADELILRAKSISNALPSAHEARGDMECDMVDYILEKMEKKKRDETSLNSIVENFIQKVGGGAPADAPQTVEAEPASTDDYMFDPSSNVAQQTLTNLGWKVGCIIALKKEMDPKQPRANEQFEIAYINDDGSVGANKLDKDGNRSQKVTVIEQADLAKLWKVVDASSRLSCDPKYPMKVDTFDGLYESIATIGINAAFFNNKKGNENGLYVQATPTSRLIVQQEGGYKSGQLVFVAWGAGVKPKKETSEEALLAFIQIKNKATVYFEIDKPDQKKVSIDFWKVRKVSDEENSNMKIAMVEQNVTVPTIKEVGVAASIPIVVSVPSAVLTKDVQVGDELVLHVPRAEKPDKKRTLNVASKPKAKAKISASK